MSETEMSVSEYQSVSARASQLSRAQQARLLAELASQLSGQSKEVDPAGLSVTQGEDALFDEIWRRTAGQVTGLCLDGLPSPEQYFQDPNRTLFVFKEANLLGLDKQTQDIRVMLRERSQSRAEGERIKWEPWWDRKVALFAHAIQMGDWESFQNKELPNLLQYGFIELKRTAGGGNANDALMKHLVARDADLLRVQLELYKPRVILACGKSTSPAVLLSSLVLRRKAVRVEPIEGLKAWTGRWTSGERFIMLETLHPSFRVTKTLNQQGVYQNLARAYASALGRLLRDNG